MQNLIERLGQVDSYNPKEQKCFPFSKSTDIIYGIEAKLGNMCGGFPFEFNGEIWKSSEVLYLAGEFSCGSEEETRIQNEMCESISGFAAKKFVKNKNKDKIRADFNEFRVQWMLYVVWQKCTRNKDFANLLKQIPSKTIIIENTTLTERGDAPSVWGAKNKELMTVRTKYEKELKEWYETKVSGMTKKDFNDLLSVEVNKIQGFGTWIGENNLGKILTICRDCLYNNTEPEIDYDLLNSKNIHILGKRIEFKKQ